MIKSSNNKEVLSAINNISELLRFHFKPTEYGSIIIPLLLARRMDLILQDTLSDVLDCIQEYTLLHGQVESDSLDFVFGKTSCNYYRTNSISLQKINEHKEGEYKLFEEYFNGYSSSVRDIFDGFSILNLVNRLIKKNIIHDVLDIIVSLDFSYSSFDNSEMGVLFETITRNFYGIENESLGAHFTPDDAVELVISLAIPFNHLKSNLNRKDKISIYDPTSGTGRLLSAALSLFNGLSQQDSVSVFGQELNPESYAICKSDMLSSGGNISNISLGNTLSEDKFPENKFDYMISNPPYGIDWKSIEGIIKNEHNLGSDGRFSPGLPRTSDGQLLFLLHLISKLPEIHVNNVGGRIAIVLNSAPMTSGNAGSGESKIRQYILQNDLLESVISLPNDMFYNTNIGTYIWVLTNKKDEKNKGKIILVDAAKLGTEMQVAMGNKRKFINQENRSIIMNIYQDVQDWNIGCMENGSYVPYPSDVACPKNCVSSFPIMRVVNTMDFIYRELVVERPKYDENGNIVYHTKGKNKGKVVTDIDMRSIERIPFERSPLEFMATEVTPFLPDAFLDMSKECVGAEISFDEHFFVPEVLPTVAELDAEIRKLRDLIFAEGI